MLCRGAVLHTLSCELGTNEISTARQGCSAETRGEAGETTDVNRTQQPRSYKYKFVSFIIHSYNRQLKEKGCLYDLCCANTIDNYEILKG